MLPHGDNAFLGKYLFSLCNDSSYDLFVSRQLLNNRMKRILRGQEKQNRFYEIPVLSLACSSLLGIYQKVSLSSQDTEKVFAALDSEQDKAREDAQAEVNILKEQLSQVEEKLKKLLDIYLDDALSTEEYAAKKQSLLSQKIALNEKITDFETKGLSWLEPAREFVKSLNQAANLVQTDNLSELPTFLKNIGSNHILRNREFVFTPKIEYKLVAERSEANQNSLTFPTWCCNYTLRANLL